MLSQRVFGRLGRRSLIGGSWAASPSVADCQANQGKLFQSRFASSDAKAIKSSAAVSVTPRAQLRFKKLLERRDMSKGAVQISVKEKGCAGLSYTIDFHPTDKIMGDNNQSLVTVLKADDTNGFALVIDRKSLGFLIGAEIDWVEGDVSSQFVFKNPNASHSCPCGRSFAT